VVERSIELAFTSTFGASSSRAMVIGATLAFGTCALACSEDPSTNVREVAHRSAIAQPPPPEPTTVALDAARGRNGTIAASPGFTPDPLVRPGTTAGGPLAANEQDERCRGFVSAEPDYVLDADRPFAELALMVSSREDTTLFVVGPDGEARCADDDDGAHPVLRTAFAAGRYRVWVGTRNRNVEAPYVLALSELADSRPSTLTH
jgi:hypothetical protein